MFTPNPKYTKVPKKRDKRGKHTKKERIEKKKSAIVHVLLCKGCDKELDCTFTTEEGDAIVCRHCGVVDNQQCFDNEAPPFDINKRSPLYMHKNYYAEKLLQSRNKEPRLTSKEIYLLSMVFDIFEAKVPLWWNEIMYTKKHQAQICRLISKCYPKSVFTRRIERWFQYREHIVGDEYVSLPKHLTEKLRLLFDPYCLFFTLYVSKLPYQRKNITQLDLVTLYLLYNIDKDYLTQYGWFFLNHNIINLTPSVYNDLNMIKNIFEEINDNVLTIRHNNTISPDCLAWFRQGNKLKVPTVERILDYVYINYMSMIVYSGFKKNNDAGYVIYNIVNNNPLPILDKMRLV